MASNYRKWGGKETQDPNDPLHVVLFVSRNKDNKDVPGFEERRRAFLYHIPSGKWTTSGLDKKFDAFVNEGVPSEFSRMYVSVNARDPEKIKRELMHRLIDDNLISNCPLTHMNAVVTSIAAGKERAAEKHWMFDVDLKDASTVNAVFNEINNFDKNLKPKIYETPHGYAIITERGFDMRQCRLLEYYVNQGTIELKRDDQLCVQWKRNSE